MEALNSLYQDHRLISRVLTALEAFAAQLGQGDADSDRRWLRRFHRFFQDFVGLNHHDKEESILMPALQRYGFHWTGGVLENFRKEHDHERYLLRSLHQACAQESPWTDYDLRSLRDLLTQLVEFARNHIKHENVDVLLTAVNRLPPEALQDIDEQLARFVDEIVTREAQRSLVSLAEELIAEFAPSEQ